MFYLFEFFLPCVSNASLMVGLGRCIITMVAFVFLFSTLCCQMSPQTASFWDCIVISVAFVWLLCVFSNESLDFLPKKIQNHIGCISLLFSTVGFQMSPQLVLMRWYIFTFLIFSLNFFPIWCYICFYFSLLGLFIWVCKLLRWEDVKLHRLHLFVF